jgi:hypothetical protein
MKHILIFFLIIFFYGSYAKADFIAYFYINSPSCNSCCISAIEILSNELLNLNIKQINIILNEKNGNLKSLLNKNKLINNIKMLNENQLNQSHFSNSGMDLVIKDSLDNIIYYFPEFTNTMKPLNTIKKYNIKTEYSLQDSDLIFTNVLSPSIIGNDLFFIDPNELLIYKYSLKNKKLNVFFDASKQAKYYFFDSLKESKDIWDMTYEKYKSFIKYLFIFSDSIHLFSYINILSGYDFDSTKKQVNWKEKSAILQLDSTEKVIPFLTEDKDIFLLSGYTRLYSLVNDSIILMPTINNTNNLKFSFFNSYRKSFTKIFISAEDLNVLSLDSLLFVADNNNIFFYDYQSDKALYLKFGLDNSLKKSVTKKIIHTVDNPVYDIMAFNDNLYFLFYRPELNNQLYVEEFQMPDFTFSKAFILHNDENFLTNKIPVKIEKDKLFILSSDDKSNWILEEYSLFEE